MALARHSHGLSPSSDPAAVVLGALLVMLTDLSASQILGRALGGKTGRAVNGWDIGLTTVNVSSNSCELMAALKIPAPLRVIQCHRDEVLLGMNDPTPPPHPLSISLSAFFCLSVCLSL